MAKDTTPHGGEIMQPPHRTIPEPLPEQEGDEPRGDPDEDEDEDEPEISQRPPLPSHTEPMAVHADEEADVPTHAGWSATGLRSLHKQKG
ncbi:MAG: hypothetical protein NDJ19_11795 [Ramlibacter sp.]|nr:hypothetical protein [Ramlibacter sp.]